MTRSPRLARARDRTVRRALATEQGRAFFEGMQWRPKAHLRAGMVVDDGHPLVGLQLGQPRTFFVQEHRQVLLDRVTGNGWAVLGVGVDVAAWPDVEPALRHLDPVLVHVPLDDTVADCGPDVRVAIDVDTRLYAELESARGQFVLLRPDRFIAAVAPAADLDALGVVTTGWLQPDPAMAR